MRVVSAVRPSFPEGSSTEPVRKTRRTLTMGLLGTGSTTSFIGSMEGSARYGTASVGAGLTTRESSSS